MLTLKSQALIKFQDSRHNEILSVLRQGNMTTRQLSYETNYSYYSVRRDLIALLQEGQVIELPNTAESNAKLYGLPTDLNRTMPTFWHAFSETLTHYATVAEAYLNSKRRIPNVLLSMLIPYKVAEKLTGFGLEAASEPDNDYQSELDKFWATTRPTLIDARLRAQDQLAFIDYLLTTQDLRNIDKLILHTRLQDYGVTRIAYANLLQAANSNTTNEQQEVN